MTYAQAVAQASRRLSAANVDGAMRDARWLMCHCSGMTPAGLVAHGDDSVSGDVRIAFDAAVARREKAEPIAQIIGSKEFYGRSFKVTRDTLAPRPETELLVELALQTSPRRVLDLGTGTGCLAISILAEAPDASGVAVDLSDDALKIAAENAALYGVSERLELVKSDWFEGLIGQFDCIISNPPYVTENAYKSLAPDVRNWEPKLALTAANDGLEAYQLIAARIGEFLLPEGSAFFEYGIGQAEAVSGIFRQAGFNEIAVFPDLSGRDRAVRVQNSPTV